MQVRQDIIDSDKKLVEGVINQLIQWIYEINFANADYDNYRKIFDEENKKHDEQIRKDLQEQFIKEG